MSATLDIQPTSFAYHTESTAPQASLSSIAKSKQVFGFLPNLHAVMAEAPSLLAGYHALWDLFLAGSSFSPLEQQVVMMTANVENDCHYCVPGHTYIMTAAKMPQAIIDALRDDAVLPDPQLEVLRQFTKEMICNRGHLSEGSLEGFLQAGYTKRQALEVIVGLSLKLLSNYTNAIAHTDVDGPVRKFAWVHPGRRR
jgi:alkylhydroperoxidase family enzyme